MPNRSTIAENVADMMLMSGIMNDRGLMDVSLAFDTSMVVVQCCRVTFGLTIICYWTVAKCV